MMLDPRALANLLLDIAEQEGVGITNLALNKIAYFVHGTYMSTTGKPLIDAKIEAWKYGPVFREIYHQFKEFGDNCINVRARTLNTTTGQYEICPCEVEKSQYKYLSDIAIPYIKMRVSALVELSHVNEGPWHKAWFYDGTANPGMEITNESIKSHFCQQVRH